MAPQGNPVCELCVWRFSFHSIIFLRIAVATAWQDVLQPINLMILCRYVSTVMQGIKIRSAIFRVVNPEASKNRISLSRAFSSVLSGLPRRLGRVEWGLVLINSRCCQGHGTIVQPLLERCLGRFWIVL